MERITLKNGVAVSRLSIGTWPFSGVKLWGDSDDREAVRTVHAALERGLNTFDTAARYGDGKSEEVLGRALKGRRQEAVVCSKVHTAFLGYDDVIAQCEASLRRLGTDYLDLYQIHWPNPRIPLEETLRAFEDLECQGKIRGLSVCNFGPKDLAAAGDRPVLNQLPYSLVWRLIEKNGALSASQAAGIPVWAYCALGQGLLTGKFRTIEDVPMGRRGTRFYSSKWGQGRHTDGGYEEEIFPFLAALRQVSDKAEVSMQALALAFLKAQPAVGSVLMGVRSVRQLEENLAAFETPVPAEALAEAEALSAALRDKMGTNADLWENENGGRMR